jgi:hypothetical protein
MNFTDIVKTLAPTVASALGGPLAGAAVTALGGILGLVIAAVLLLGWFA